jgi:hypothetical protein
MAQQAAPHAGDARVDLAEQRRRGRAPQRLGELEVATRRGIQAQVLVAAFGKEGDDMGQRLGLRLARVGEQGTCGTEGEIEIGDAEAVKARDAEVLLEQPGSSGGVEVPDG